MELYSKNQPETIQKMFGSIAERYDRANAVMSFNMHKYWNRKLVETLVDPYKKPILLDLCSGTGDIAYEYLRQSPHAAHVYLLDFCAEMLEIARLKCESFGSDQDEIEFLVADAQEIPLPDASIPHVTMAYGIRNIQNPQKCLADIYRVLEPGGQVAILELTQPQNAILRFGHKVFLHTFLPLVGKLITPDEEAYRYLCQSIQSFTPPKGLNVLMKEVGLSLKSITPMMGGIATIFHAFKK